ncbi:tape measure protein [Thermincola ferriacetica]
MAQTIGELLVKIGADISGFARGLTNAQQRIDRFQSNIDRAAPVFDRLTQAAVAAGAAIGTALGGATVAGVKANAEYEQLRIGFETMLGSAQKANAFLKELQMFAAKTPFEFDDVTGAAKKFMALGFEANQVIPTLTAVGNAVSALGGGKEMIDRVTMALGQMQTKGRVQAEELLQLAEQGIPVYEILKEKLGLTAEQVANIGKEGIKSDAAIKAIVEGLNERFPNMMEKQSSSLLGLLSTAKDYFKIVLKDITGPLFDQLKVKLQEAMKAFDELKKTGKLDEWIKRGQEIMTSFLNVLEKVGAAVIKIGGWVIENWGAIQPVLIGIGAAVASFQAISAAMTIIEGLANPIGLTVMAIGALVAAGVALYQNWDEIKAKAAQIWQGIKDTISGFTNPIKEAVVGVWEAIKIKTAEIWDGIKAFFDKWWPLLLAVFTGPLGLAVAWVVGHWDEIKAKTAEIWNAIKDFFVRYWDQLKWAFGPVAVLVTYVVQNWDKIKNTTTMVWDSIRKTVSEKFTAVKETVSGIANEIKGIFDRTVGAAWDWGKNLIQEFIDGIKSKISAFVDTLEDVSNEIKDFLGFSSPTEKGPGRYADRWAPNFMKMFVEGLESYRPQLATTMADMAELMNFTGGVSFSRAALAGVPVGGGASISVLVTGNYLANSVDEERLARRISQQIARDYFNSTGGSF